MNQELPICRFCDKPIEVVADKDTGDLPECLEWVSFSSPLMHEASKQIVMLHDNCFTQINK